MKINVVKAGELSATDLDRWRLFQEGNPDLASPYFCPEYTQSVAAVRKDVFVGILEADGKVVGYFPFQRRRFGFGGPPGSGFCDLQGIVASPETQIDPQELLRGCGLVSWEFTDLLASQTSFAKYQAKQEDNHYLELSGGFDKYLEALRATGSSQPSRIRTIKRKADAAFAKVEFVPHVNDKKLLAQLIEWKSRQYREGGLRDVFSFGWPVELLHRILDIQTPSFAGIFSVLYFDDKVAAMHMGMRSRTIWHWWFPRHDQELEKHTPGILLLIKMMESANGLGVKRIDLGSGDEVFKLRLRSGGVPVLSGRVEVPSIAVKMLRLREATESWVRRSPLLGVIRGPGRLLKRFEQWNQFR
jgi:CelD/BcsL family acetyltransferase involved in cellulose biosynthesis